jgi:hypothetical protein
MVRVTAPSMRCEWGPELPALSLCPQRVIAAHVQRSKVVRKVCDLSKMACSDHDSELDVSAVESRPPKSRSAGVPLFLARLEHA